MRLAIADPPYPPRNSVGGRKNRASRWYGDGQRSVTDSPADHHPDAAEWDDPARHRRLLEQLVDEYDGWAIATSPDGLEAYMPLPLGVRIMAWVKGNAQPGSHRLRSMWEPVIIAIPPTRINARVLGQIPDVLTAGIPRSGFIGSKPEPWTRWVLEALGYEPGDEVVDLFPGSGAVSSVLAQGVIL